MAEAVGTCASAMIDALLQQQVNCHNSSDGGDGDGGDGRDAVVCIPENSLLIR